MLPDIRNRSLNASAHASWYQIGLGKHRIVKAWLEEWVPHTEEIHSKVSFRSGRQVSHGVSGLYAPPCCATRGPRRFSEGDSYSSGAGQVPYDTYA